MSRIVGFSRLCAFNETTVFCLVRVGFTSATVSGLSSWFRVVEKAL
jgi:hypothetical protein